MTPGPAHRYRAFGLSVAADGPLPELLPDPAGAGAPDIAIRFDEGAAARVAALGACAEAFDFRDDGQGGAVLNLPGILALRVAGGGAISVSAARAADAGLVRLYVIGSGLGMALHQRGALVLHGATVAGPQGGAWLLLGARGAGKSTLAAALGQRGARVLGDDVAAVWSAAQAPRIWPGSAVLKLTPAALGVLGIAEAGLARVAGSVDKRFLPNRATGQEPVPLAGLVVLGGTGAPELTALGGLDALTALVRHGYRGHCVDLLGRRTAQFLDSAALVRAVPVLRLVRPRDLSALGEVADLLMRRIGDGSGRGA